MTFDRGSLVPTTDIIYILVLPRKEESRPNSLGEGGFRLLGREVPCEGVEIPASIATIKT